MFNNNNNAIINATKFTLNEIQKVYEIILGKSLVKQNFRKWVDKFVEDVYAFHDEHPEFGLNRYGETLEKNGLEWGGKMSTADVSDKDAQCILALIIGAVRAERFCDGALMGFFKDGSIEKWLMRLHEIDGGNN